MKTPTAYPLTWPPTWPRTDVLRREASRMKTTLPAALNNLKREVNLLGGKDLVLSSNYTLGNERPKDSGVVAYFHSTIEDCPHCAKTGDGGMCGECSPPDPRPGYKCTRPVGHEGDHIACASEVHAIHTWPREAPPFIPPVKQTA